MRKQFFSIVFLFAFFTASSPAAFSESVMDRINRYENPQVSSLFRKALWFSSDSEEIREYANTIEDSPANPMGQHAINAYGGIGPDNANIVFKSKETGEVIETLGLVSSPPRVLLHRYGFYSAEV